MFSDTLKPPLRQTAFPGVLDRESYGLLSVAAFTSMWLVVGLVSAYDAFLIVKYQHVIHDFEMNPLGRWMMNLEHFRPISDTSGVANFLGCKFAGTVVVLGMMGLIYWRRERLGLTVAGAVALFQLALGAFLTWA